MPPKKASTRNGGAQRPQNIHDLAKLAGVSAATVSRALAGTGKVSQATRDRIRKLAADHDFQPSSMARNLRTGRTGTIGVIVPLGHEKTQHLSDPFFMTLLGHIADRLADRGYDLLLSRVVPSDPSWLRQLADSGRVDGMIIIGQSNQAEVIDSVARSYPPLVVWGAQLPEQEYCSVGSDNRLGGRMAAEHLLEQGCRKLAFFGDPSVPEVEQRLQGFREALRDMGQGAVGANLPVHFVPEKAIEEISGFLDLADSLDGIFAMSDTIGMMAIQALVERGRAVPGDVKVIGFDDLEMARRTLPPLSSIRQDLEAGADALVDLVFRRMQGEEAHSVTLKPTLVARASTAKN
ncbi:DNA-binding LacI/PurR family transcriptional regulator [Altererythrobacter atlanticus]|uniref:HTH-type transcriptional repressor CytR n=1 Tax=Croceibacterium atlanticum TaxID=1267766 RepID=A0A0F7KLH9_9SPHN|nr:LacI family DNA-binding transcriptional regulator [Croceibacterium atlanticum]AKH41403.1 HTH-type transcriptional repressor CytR [Croceibacterium atlanticum]MBB5732865.1 DNA-binding LacI/PurR family transcriptional regulator [Croceibacterium atlanticum]